MLVTFEGIDGSGKSTQARLLIERLEGAGHRTLLVREPGGTALSERVRTLLLEPALPITPLAELLLFSAARAQLVEERIRPALAEGRVVVCDRFYDSTTAYQGGGRELQEDAAWLSDFNRRVTGGLVPDRTYLIEVDPALAQARRAGRAGAVPAADRMEQTGGGFYAQVAAAYRALAEREPERVCALDGARPVDRLHEEIWADVRRLLAARSGTRSAASGSP